jgi:hypothetical protein
MKKITSIFVAVAFVCTMVFASVGFAADPSASFKVDTLNKYVFRGMEMSDDSVVVQPEVKAGYGDLSVALWGNLDSNNAWDELESEDWTLNEMDFTAKFVHDFDKFKAGIGYTHYSFDVANPFMDDTAEVFGLVGLNVVLNPTLTVYKDIDALETWYFNLGVSHNIELVSDVSLGLAASAGYIIDEDDMFGYDGFNEGVVSAELNVPLGQYFSFVPMVGYSFPLTSDAEDFIENASISEESSFLFGGASLRYEF